MSKRDLQKRKKRELRKKQAKRRATTHALDSGFVPDSLMRRMDRKHADVLQNIEAVLHDQAQEDRRIDDQAVFAALKGALHGKGVEHEPADSLYEALQDVREMREDIGDGVWRDGLRVVMSSVRNHSTTAVGDKGYLRFISSFL